MLLHAVGPNVSYLVTPIYSYYRIFPLHLLFLRLWCSVITTIYGAKNPSLFGSSFVQYKELTQKSEKGVYRVLVGKPEGRRPLGRRRPRWVDKIRMDLQEVGCGYMDWIGLAQDRDRWRTLVSAVMGLRVSWNAGNLTSCKPVSFSRRTLHHGVNI